MDAEKREKLVQETAQEWKSVMSDGEWNSDFKADLRALALRVERETLEDAARNLWKYGVAPPPPTRNDKRYKDRIYAVAELRRMAGEVK